MRPHPSDRMHEAISLMKGGLNMMQAAARTGLTPGAISKSKLYRQHLEAQADKDAGLALLHYETAIGEDASFAGRHAAMKEVLAKFGKK